MPRAVAEEITLEFFEKIRQKGKDCVEIAEKINRMIKADDAYQKSMLEGMKAIITHMQKGGKTMCTEMPLSAGANEIFKDLMRKYQVPFVSAKTGDDKKEQIFYRDKDVKIVQMCRIELIKTLDFMCEELSPKDFFKKYINDEIKGINGLDKADIELIRREVTERNDISNEIDYTVVKDLNDEAKEMILFPSSISAEIEKIIDRVIFDFSGEEGKAKKDTVLRMIEEKQRMQNIISNNVNAGKEVCLIDSINPNIFCLINEKGIFFHHLSREINESGEEYIKDDVVRNSDIRKISSFTSGLYKPVLMSLKEVNFIKGVDNEGNIKTDLASYDDDLSMIRNKMLILPQKRRYEADTVINNLRKPMNQRIRTFINLKDKDIEALKVLVEEEKLSETVIGNGEVSCTESDLSVIEGYIRDNVYRANKTVEKTELTPLLEYEYKFFHEGRGSINLTDRVKMREQNQFMIDANDERYLFKFDGDSLIAYDKDREFLKISMDDEDYCETVIKIIGNLKEPVCLEEEDIINKDGYELLDAIRSRRPDIKEYECKDELRTKLFQRFSREYEEINGKVPSNPTNRQKEALKKMSEYKKNVITVKYSEETKDLYKEPEKPVIIKTRSVDLSY